MATWQDFEPLVMPYVIGCPVPVMEFHARQAAIEFCKRTHAYQDKLAAVQVADFETVTIDVPTQANVSRVLAVFDENGEPIDLYDQGEGLEREMHGSSAPAAYTLDNIDIRVLPPPSELRFMTVLCALRPADDSTDLPRAVVPYMDAIAEGAKARIMRLPRQEFTDRAEAATCWSLFQSEIHSIAAKVSRGQMAQAMGTRSRLSRPR